MRSSHVIFFDLLGWHLTPSITDDAALHVGAMAKKQLRLPPGRPINWPIFEIATTKMSTSQFFHGSARGPGLKPISDEKCKVGIL
tara:strand:+ start:254 stop:508 length:255 start_codon:yes stop_codon:yes gene_type:complete